MKLGTYETWNTRGYLKYTLSHLTLFLVVHTFMKWPTSSKVSLALTTYKISSTLVHCIVLGFNTSIVHQHLFLHKSLCMSLQPQCFNKFKNNVLWIADWNIWPWWKSQLMTICHPILPINHNSLVILHIQHLNFENQTSMFLYLWASSR